MAKKSWGDYVREDPEIIDRFVIGAFAKNSNISNFQEFVDSLKSADRLDRANSILGEEAIKDLFDSEACKSRIRQNATLDDFEEMYEETSQGTTFIQRQKPLGSHTTAREIKTITITRPSYSVEKYTKLGKEVRGYNKTYAKWSGSQIRFLRIRKMQGISPRDIAWQYNSYFKQSARTPSSISTKLHRIKR